MQCVTKSWYEERFRPVEVNRDTRNLVISWKIVNYKTDEICCHRRDLWGTTGLAEWQLFIFLPRLRGLPHPNPQKPMPPSFLNPFTFPTSWWTSTILSFLGSIYVLYWPKQVILLQTTWKFILTKGYNAGNVAMICLQCSILPCLTFQLTSTQLSWSYISHWHLSAIFNFVHLFFTVLSVQGIK